MVSGLSLAVGEWFRAEEHGRPHGGAAQNARVFGSIIQQKTQNASPKPEKIVYFSEKIVFPKYFFVIFRRLSAL